MIREFLVTEDGSHTLYLPEIDEHYHSIHGAIQESQHIYIGQGLEQCNKNELTILEIGFGTGLNAYLTFCHTHLKKSVNYYSIEKYPLLSSEYSKLNYSELSFPENRDIFEQLHQSEWNKKICISEDFNLCKLEVDLLNYDINILPKADLIYYDAFAPVKQPEMWTDEILEKIASVLKPEGIFVTYCAKGTVRRALTQAGLTMERIPGPTGKKEILRGKKST